MIHVTPPMAAPDVVANSPLAVQGPGGWVEVDKFTTQHVRFPDVFALGDVAGLPTSRTDGAARAEAPVTAANLLATGEGVVHVCHRPLAEAMVAPDGIAVDASDGIWVANALGAECVRVEEGGAITDRVTTSQLAFACAIGGPDGRHLLVCTAAASDAEIAAASPTGRLEIVDHQQTGPVGADLGGARPRAGRVPERGGEHPVQLDVGRAGRGR